jgi:lipopolysaccharide biosynthesis regulator YciM
MSHEYFDLLVPLVALLAGLAAGKAWERYRLEGGGLVDRRKLQASPHYLQGLNYLVAAPLDPAIEEFGRAAALNERSVDVHIVLGNLYREKGQVGRAIQIHQQLLQRPRLTRHEHASVMLCLGRDFRHGGFVDRAVDAFTDVLKIDPSNQPALLNLEKLHEEQRQFAEAYRLRERLAALTPPDQQGRHRAILAFLGNELGMQALQRGERQEARLRFTAAIDQHPAAVPAYVNLGDLQAGDGDLTGAVATWERVLEAAPDRAYLVFTRLRDAYAAMGTPERYSELCRTLIGRSPGEWRARLALARHLDASDRTPAAFDLVCDALHVNPHAVLLHQHAWHLLSRLGFDPALVERYVEISRDAVFYRDPHVCVRCHYRATELMWQCPHCREWDAFVEERLTPAREEGSLRPVGQD